MHHGGIHRVNVDSVGEHHDIRPVYGVDDLVGPAPVTIATRSARWTGSVAMTATRNVWIVGGCSHARG